MSNPSDLKNIGLKATLPRLKILNLFEQSEVRHLTAEDVYRMLLAENVDIGLATVYRVLTQFEQAGLLIRHHFESGKAVYELNQGGTTTIWCACNVAAWKNFTTQKLNAAKKKSPPNAASPFTIIRCISTLTALNRSVHISNIRAYLSLISHNANIRYPRKKVCARVSIRIQYSE